MTTKQTDGERLVRLETKVDNLETLMLKVDGKLDDVLKEQSRAQVRMVSREELDKELKTIREDEIAAIMAEIKSSKKRNAFQVFITGSLAALFGSILTLLISYFFQTIGR